MRILVLGGDTRQIYCAGRLSLEPGFTVGSFALKDDEISLTEPDVLVLPYLSFSGDTLNAPFCSKKIPFEEVLGLAKKGMPVFAGRMSKDKLDALNEKGALVYDWFSDEELTVKNAALTAEGAAQIITGLCHNAVSGSDILILGWGRVAKACAALFKAMGARVTVAARREEARLDCRKKGFKAVDFISPNAISSADIVVNTVPENVLGEEELRIMKSGGIILELASKPYGSDPELAKRLGVKIYIGAGLPGKYTPESAGRLMAESVIKVLKEGSYEKQRS